MIRFILLFALCWIGKSEAFGFATADDWHLVFRVSAGVGRSAYELWTGSDTTTWPPFVDHFNETRDYYYKNPEVEKWGTLRVKRIRLAFFNLGKPVMNLIFTGLGSTKTNWFEARRLLYADRWGASIAPKMFDQKATGFVGGRSFKMRDDHFHRERTFTINHSSSYNKRLQCGHVGWMLVLDQSNEKDRSCKFGSESHRPRFFYSSKPHPIPLNAPNSDDQANFELSEASEMAIFLDY